MTAQPLQDDELDAIADRVIEKLLASGMISQPALAVTRALPETPGAEMEPFFQTSEIAQEMLRRLPVNRQRKWTFFFSDWGCLRCGSGENEGRCHSGNGFCSECRQLGPNVRITRRS